MTSLSVQSSSHEVTAADRRSFLTVPNRRHEWRLPSATRRAPAGQVTAIRWIALSYRQGTCSFLSTRIHSMSGSFLPRGVSSFLVELDRLHFPLVLFRVLSFQRNSTIWVDLANRDKGCSYLEIPRYYGMALSLPFETRSFSVGIAVPYHFVRTFHDR